MLISKGEVVAKEVWEANKCSKHYRYRLKGKAGIQRSVLMTSGKALVTTFNCAECGHAPVGTYLMRFGRREEDKCWRSRRRMLQTWEHLFCHCSRWKVQQPGLWKMLGNAMKWKVDRCRHVQISELFSMEGCDQKVMDFQAPTGIGKFTPKPAEEPGQEEQGQGWRCLDRGRSVSCFVNLSGLCLFPCLSLFSFSLIVYTSLIFLYHRGRWVTGGSSAILPARPDGEGQF